MENWHDLTPQEQLRYVTVVLSFVLGWCITIAGFIAPPIGIVDNSVLFILGQALTYCAVGVGLKDYVDAAIKKRN